MGNCLKTQLKEVVQNNNLPILDAFIFDVVYNADGNVNDKIDILVRPEVPVAPVIKALSGSFLIDGTEYTEYTMTRPYGNMYSIPNGIQLKNENAKIAILNAKNYIANVNNLIGYNASTNYNNLIKFDLGQWDYNSYIGSLLFPRTNQLYGTLAIKNVSNLTNINISTDAKNNINMNLSQFAGTTLITNFQIRNCNATGDISVLEGNIGMTTMDFADCGAGVKGSLDTFAEHMAANRTSGTLNAYLYSTSVTCSVESSFKQYTITFDQSKPKGYEITILP